MTWEIDYTPPPTGAKFMKDDSRMRVLMGPVGCVRGDTLIVTELGLIPISHIDRPMRVLSWNDKTGQFQLSWCGGAFPKGRDYLYRVVTPGGEFVASGHHQLLTSPCAYQRVDTLCRGLSVPRCSDIQRVTSSLVSRLSSVADVLCSTRKAVDSLARYAESARQYGQRFLLDEDTVQAFVPSQHGVLSVAGVSCLMQTYAEGALRGQVHTRNRLGGLFCRPCIDGFSHEVGLLRSISEGSGVGGFFSRVSAIARTIRRSLWNFAFRLRVGLQGIRCNEPVQTCSCEDLSDMCYGAIVSCERESVQEAYWDMQVLDTNNYVTADGCVHHNSGKSVTCCFEVVRRASMQAPGKDGKRRTRCAVVRETARQLQDTTMKTWLDWFPDGVCGRLMKTTKTYYLSIGDVECEVMFRALDDADDVANLNSLELTFAWFNECRDIHPDIVDAMSKRIGRFPSSKDGGPTWFGMWGDTNPPTMETWWYYQMEHLDPKDGVSPNENKWAVYKQPSGRSALAENIDNLPDGYYDTTGRSDEYIRVFIDGEYGLSSAGMPVYKYFRPDYHMAKERIRHIENGMRPIVIGCDLGLTPAAVIGQLDARGRALILAECVSFDMGIQRFIRQLLKPLLAERFSGCPVFVVTDPAGMQRAQTDERSVVDIIRAEGFKVRPARTNAISARINAVDDYLMRQVDGDPAFLVDPSCIRLKAAMMGGYRYKPRGDNVIDKNDHSHVAEALQYLMLHIGNAGAGEIVSQRREIKRVSSLGWT